MAFDNLIVEHDTPTRVAVVPIGRPQVLKSFVAGADIKELVAQTASSARLHALAGQRVFQHGLDMPFEAASAFLEKRKPRFKGQ